MAAVRHSLWSARVAMAALFVVALLPRLWFAWQPSATLVVVLRDDAWYYFTVARNVSAGLGATFDGVAPTNGYHPLWLLLLTPLWRVAPSGELPVHAALTLGSVLGAFSACVVASLVRQLFGVRVGLLSGLAFAWLPRSILLSVDGLETALALTLSLLTLHAALRFTPAASSRQFLSLAAWAGLMLVARTDTIFLFAAVFGWLAWSGRARKGQLAAAACVSGLIVSPWPLWNLWHFGSIMQVSGLAVPHVLIETGLAGQPVQLFAVAWSMLVTDYGLIPNGVVTLLRPLGSLAALVALAGVAGRAVRTRDGVWVVLWIPLIAVLALVLVHAGLRRDPQIYYFAILQFTVAVVVAGAIARAQTAHGLHKIFWSAALVLLLFGQVAPYRSLARGDYPWQGAILEYALTAAQQVPRDVTLGAFNAGILSYYSGHRVLNLDGVISNSAYDALAGHRLGRYAREHGVDYIIDYRFFVVTMYGPYLSDARVDLVRTLSRHPEWVGGDYEEYSVR